MDLNELGTVVNDDYEDSEGESEVSEDELDDLGNYQSLKAAPTNVMQHSHPAVRFTLLALFP